MHSSQLNGQTKCLLIHIRSSRIHDSSGQFKFTFRLQSYFINNNVYRKRKIKMYHLGAGGDSIESFCWRSIDLLSLIQYVFCGLRGKWRPKIMLPSTFVLTKAICVQWWQLVIVGIQPRETIHISIDARVYLSISNPLSELWTTKDKLNKNIFIINVCSSKCH